ncbi:PREDICTED: chondroitin sulfate synthase 1-like [Amphimedon queenslandica]|uniref:Hexosyltransferase n=1 Tax=Amphimedon queenslandica TaxID=400682 RepID=A0A1X7UER2_AMPQE|nr:PREDICTED: chondroitin sulfate synthase 1-like [Amphimedon queenslandica]|eukprot:XP_011405334.1 PREDICTED: chondroitin sulfate synthase 1-like [Amphimedon queenslandica]
MAVFLSNNTNNSQLYTDRSFVTELRPETYYPSLNEIVHVLHHLYENYARNYEYFLIISDNAYVNMYSFEDVIHKLAQENEELIYAGFSKSFGLHEFCGADSGVLISVQTLSKVIENINNCIGWSKRYYWDVMLGQCLRKTLGIKCLNISRYFLNDDQHQSLSPAVLWSSNNSIYSSAFSVSPVTTYDHMNLLHYYYNSLQMKRYLAKAESLRKIVHYTCEELSHFAFDHQTVTKDCENIARDISKPLYERYRKKQTQKWRRYDMMPSWDYFDAENIYAGHKTEPSVQISDDRVASTDIEMVTSVAETVVQEKYQLPDLKLTAVINGYMRQNVLKGSEYILDAQFGNSKLIVNDRVRLLQPFLPNVTAQVDKDDLSEVVNVIVPISNSNGKCIKFIQTYLKKSLKNSIHLILIVYKKTDFEKMREKVNKITTKYKRASITVVKGKGRFSRAKALHQGISTLKRSDLAFFCDVDLNIESHFYDRCRRNTIQGSQVYLPSVVKLYNPKLYTKVHHSSNLPLNRQTGHWGSYNYGMLCIYKSDYLYVGGLNIRMRGWGGEDLDFLQRLKSKGLVLFRAPDKGLIHHWHERDCSTRSVRRHMKSHCESNKIEALGDRRTLARYIFNLTETKPSLLL